MIEEVALIIVAVVVSQGVASWLTVERIKVHLCYHRENIDEAKETAVRAHRRIDKLVIPQHQQAEE